MADNDQVEPTDSAIARALAGFRAGLRSIDELLRHQLEEAWRSLEQLAQDQGAAEATVRDGTPEVVAANYEELRAAAARAVLAEPLRQWERLRPFRRMQDALESAHRGLDDLIRRMAPVAATGPELLAAIETAVPGLSGSLVARRRKPWPLELEILLGRAVADLEAELTAAEAQYLQAACRLTRDVDGRWDRLREAIDLAMAGPEAPPSAPPETEPGAAPVDSADAALDRLDRWFEAVAELAEQRVARSLAWHRTPRPAGPGRRTRFLEHWAEQLDLIERELRFNRDLDRSERELIALGNGLATALEGERKGLLAGVDTLLTWLGRELESPSAEPMPPQVAPPVVPALRRIGELDADVGRIADRLPSQLRLVRRIELEPTRRGSTSQVAPDRMARESFELVGRPVVAGVLEDVQAEHVALLQQIERARQVVAFAAEEQADGADGNVVREAMENARSLLDVDRRARTAAMPTERTAILGAVARATLENRSMLSRNRLGALAHLGRLGVRRGAIVLATAALPVLRRALGWITKGARELYRRFLVAIQWAPETDLKAIDVARRPYLPREFTADPRARELPAIYRRLFRFDAVDDVRFLVGRDREMQALAEARSFWEADRPVAALVVGERGSGKTSLINCALDGPLSGLSVVRGEFHTRLATASGVRRFLAEMVGVSDPEQLEATLLAERRVVVLEETERSFLREVGGFGGIRELERIIAATSASTFWLVVINQHAFRLLDAAVKLGATFSHRLDAASAAPAAVREAILVRHNLSGLRLRFVAPALERGWWARLKLRVRGAADPEPPSSPGSPASRPESSARPSSSGSARSIRSTRAPW
ncbi:MAG: ATP-binding protein [Gemmatimonadales bacterium]